MLAKRNATVLGNPTGPHGWDIQVCQITVQYPKVRRGPLLL